MQPLETQVAGHPGSLFECAEDTQKCVAKRAQDTEVSFYQNMQHSSLKPHIPHFMGVRIIEGAVFVILHNVVASLVSFSFIQVHHG